MLKLLAAVSLLGGISGASPLVSLPDVEVRTHRGHVLRLAEWHGSTVLVAFWATWCGPCREELDALQRASASPGGRFKVLAVATDAMGWRTVLPFIRERNISIPVTLLTPALRKAFQLSPEPPFLPMTLMFDRGGRLAARFQGPIPRERLLSGR